MIELNGIADDRPNGKADIEIVPLQIAGKDVLTNVLFDVENPGTGKNIWKCCSASIAEAELAVEAAHAAFQSWSKTKPAFRRDIFLKAAAIFENRADECRRYMVEETGAQPSFFDNLNLPLTVEMMRDCAGRIASVTAGSVPMAASAGTNAMSLKVPFGVVLGISPW